MSRKRTATQRGPASRRSSRRRVVWLQNQRASQSNRHQAPGRFTHARPGRPVLGKKG